MPANLLELHDVDVPRIFSSCWTAARATCIWLPERETG